VVTYGRLNWRSKVGQFETIKKPFIFQSIDVYAIQTALHKLEI